MAPLVLVPAAILPALSMATIPMVSCALALAQEGVRACAAAAAAAQSRLYGPQLCVGSGFTF